MTRTRHDQINDIVIVGSGPVAMTLAIAAARSGFSVALPEPDHAACRPAVAISAGCWRLLDRIGVATTAHHRACPIMRLEADGGYGPLVVTPEDVPANAGEEPIGYVIAYADLIAALTTSLGATDQVSLAGSHRAQAIRVDGHSITCEHEDSSCQRARLLVACDGAASPLCALAGIGRTNHRHDACAIVFAISTDHQKVARQIFTPRGPMAMLPMVDGRATIIWTETISRSAALMALSDSDFARQFAEHAPSLVRAPCEIDTQQTRQHYPITMGLSQSLVASRLAVAGDAARSIHPLAGQGFNLGLKDVAALLHVIEDARHAGLDIGNHTTLAEYQRWRRTDSVGMTCVTEGIASLMTAPAPLRRLGAIGLAALGNIAPLRRLAAAQAGSVLGTLPRLLQMLDP